MPLLTYPLALIGLVAAPALVAIYLLHNRFRRHPVSAVFLWESLTRRRQGGSRVHRVQTPLLFFLELLALLLLALAAADPRWWLHRRAVPLVVVLDNSASMLAREGSDSSRDRAVRTLERIVRELRPSSVRFVLAGARPRVLGPPAVPEQAHAMLTEWTCHGAEADLQAGVGLASQLGGERARLLVLTDQRPPAPIPQGKLCWMARGLPVPNRAVTAAVRSAGPEGTDRCLLEIRNCGTVETTLDLLIRIHRTEGEEPDVLRRGLTIGADSRRTVDLTVPAGARLVHAALPDDCLALDNHAYLLPAAPPRVRVRIAIRDEDLRRHVRRAIDATGLASDEQSNPHLVLTDRDVPSTASRWVLHWVRPRDAAARVGPFFIDRSHPLARGIDLTGAVWMAGPSDSMQGLPVITSGNEPLLVARQTLEGGRVIGICLGPEGSSILQTPNWPILMWNCLNWRAGELPGFRERQVRLGAQTMLRLDSETPPDAAVNITGPGLSRDVPVRRRRAIAFAPPAPGVYTATAPAVNDRLACNLLAPAESQLQTCDTGEWGGWLDANTRHNEFAGAAPLLALIVLGLLAGHSWLVRTAM